LQYEHKGSGDCSGKYAAATWHKLSTMTSIKGRDVHTIAKPNPLQQTWL
jgi:hypothetical protein